ncbi:MAG: response regulator transcription factor [Candidatus Aminicenantes bacterium]|nr:response regulator transcription factor [Candidatus Aminicenantes bacterium]
MADIDAPIRVLHVDDDRDHHALVKVQIGRLDDGIVLERVDSCRSAMAALEDRIYDCVLTDDETPKDAGLGLLAELRRRGILIPFVILSDIDAEGDHHVKTGVVAGDGFHVLVDHFHFELAGYWIRRLDERYRQLLSSDRTRAELFGATPEKIAALRAAAAKLTARERQILEMVGAGKSNKDIADELFISYKTAKNHVSNIFAKLGIHTRAEAIHLVLLFAWLPEDEDKK